MQPAWFLAGQVLKCSALPSVLETAAKKNSSSRFLSSGTDRDINAVFCTLLTNQIALN